MSKSQNVVLNKQSSGFTIFAKALKVFKNHIYKLLALLAICAIVNVAFIGLEFHLSGNVAHLLINSNYLGDVLNDPDIGYSVYLKQILLSKTALFVFTLIYLLNLIFSYCINLSSLKIISNGDSPLRALGYILRKIIPIFVTDVMAVLTLLVALVFAILFGCIFFFLGQITHIAVAVIGITLLTVAIFILLLRLLFCSQICVMEQKYYFEAIDLSFKYTKNHIVTISWKLSALFMILIFITTVILLPLSFFEMPRTFLVVKYVLTILLLPQLATIYNYLLYKIYKKKIS